MSCVGVSICYILTPTFFLGDSMTWIYIIFGVAVFIFCLWFMFHMPRLGVFNLCTGGIKCGKSLFSIWLVRRKYRRAMLLWFWKCIKAKILRRELPERPLIYSNIKLRMPYVQITTDDLLRRKRFRYGSIVFIDEASLFSDSQLIQDSRRNVQLMLFNKLIGHELHGGSGCIIYNTQSLQDLHYSIRRCVSNFIYCDHSINLPFFRIIVYYDRTYSEDLGMNNSLNSINEGKQGDMHIKILPKKYYKYYDSCCYSSFTDDLPIEEEIVNLGKHDSLKMEEIVSFRPEIRNGGKDL